MKDSANYFYAGSTQDIKNVYNKLNVGYADSSLQNTWSHVYANNYEPVVKSNSVRQQIMPDVKGMGLKDAIYLLENMGLKVIPKGKGKVMAQSLEAGSSISKGLTVYLQLS